MRYVRLFPPDTRSSADKMAIIEGGGATRLALMKDTEAFLSYGIEYWDSSNGIGYGGYRYDGRYGPVVDKIIQYYGLSPGDKIFELGCGKGYILVEFLIRGMQVAGVDLSCYAIANAAPNVRPFVRQGDFLDMELSVQTYDLVLGKDIMAHIAEASVADVVEKCKQLSKKYIYYEIEVCRNDFEAEMLYKWDITHVTRRPPNWWKEKLYEVGYPGDYHFKVLIEDPALGSFE